MQTASNLPKFRLFNTMSRQVEAFQPPQTRSVGLYACGFTVYDYTHLGHLRKYAMDDVLVRALRAWGFEVKFVQNVTDVGHLSSDADEGEDKLEKGAKKYKQSVWDVAKKFEDYFFYSMDLMGNLRPDVSCRATEHIEQQLAMVLELEKKGHTYIIPDDGVYFDTTTISDYGKLARLAVDGLQAGARVAADGKRNATDFALWKFERAGENRAMVWKSPWHPRSFPGWHIECSAMAMHYLGDQFAIHTGGIDHIPVHHTNEIAQAEAASGKKPFVQHWVHHNHLHVDGEKMSKSLGNFYTIDDVLERGYSPQALRLLFLGTHYRSEMNFTWESLAAAAAGWKKLLHQYARLLSECDDRDEDDENQNKEKNETSVDNQIENQAKNQSAVTDLRQRFYESIADDLNTAKAVAVMWEVLKHDLVTNKAKKLLLDEFDQILGLGFERALDTAALDSDSDDSVTAAIPANVRALLTQRQQARDAKDWARADEIRQRIAEQGYEVSDTQMGQSVSYIN